MPTLYFNDWFSDFNKAFSSSNLPIYFFMVSKANSEKLLKVPPLLKLEVETPNLRTIDTPENRLNDWTLNVKGSIDRNYTTALYDAADRAEKFDLYLSQFEQKISLRENYLSYIRQLEQRGKKSQSSLVEGLGDSSFTVREKSQQFVNDHNSLVDRDSGKAHEQYLLKYNDYLKGNLDFSENITIDGVDLSGHTHNQEDGSGLIDGRYVQETSIRTDLASRDSEDRPQALTLVDISVDGVEASAKFFWLSKNNSTLNEIQISRLESIDFTDPGQEEP